ncbi:MAG: hypothetical protein U0Q18_12730 [Bryobacteraceae bacterium]
MGFLKRLFDREGGQAPAVNPVETFNQAKDLAAQAGSRQVVLIRPDLSLLALACPDAHSIPDDVIQQIESIVPSSVKRNIAVVTDTRVAPSGARAEVDSPAWTGVGKDIPFFGILNGLGCIGHAVWIFDASADLGIACRDADILIIDSGVSQRVPEPSLDSARRAMRTPTIFVHDRETFKLSPVPPTAPKAGSWELVFDEARTRTRQGEQCRIVFVRHDQSLLCMPCIPRSGMTKEQLSQAHRVIPQGTVRNVAVIASTELAADPSDSQSPQVVAQLRAAGRSIPFFGLLLNLASAGNPLWIFDGGPEMIVPGCRNADLLFIDSALADRIPMKMLDEAAGVMRSANIAVYDRNSRKIALIRSLGGSMDKLVFRD